MGPWLKVTDAIGLDRDYVTSSSAMPEQRSSSNLCWGALEFKCSVLWAMLDALHHAYLTPAHIPLGTLVPRE
jgi:hypothetical protein